MKQQYAVEFRMTGTVYVTVDDNESFEEKFDEYSLSDLFNYVECAELTNVHEL